MIGKIYLTKVQMSMKVWKMALIAESGIESLFSSNIFFGDGPLRDYGGGHMQDAFVLFGSDYDEGVFAEAWSAELSMQEVLEGTLPYGRNEERIYSSTELLLKDFSYVPLDRIYDRVVPWEFKDSTYNIGRSLFSRCL